MGYGTRGRRVDAKSAGLVEDIDFNKVGLLCNAERGVAGLHDNIYALGTFKKYCGGYVSTNYGAYIAKSFFDTKKNDVRVEMKVLYFVADDAAQADYQPQNGGPNDSFDLKAGLKGAVDKSAFGNKIGVKLTNTEELTYTLTADIEISGTLALLTSVDNLKVGHYIHLKDGTVDEMKEILTVDPVALKVTFTALSNVGVMTIATTVIARCDMSLFIAVKNIDNIWEQVEEHTRIPFEDDVATLISELEIKSFYLYAEAIVFIEVDDAALPADITTWTALASGADGTSATDADFNTLVSGFDNSDVAILLAPEFQTVAHNVNMLAYVNNGYKACYYVTMAEGADQDALMDFASQMRETISFGMIPMDKWFDMDDPLQPGTFKAIPNIGVAAAHYFNNYDKNGIGKVAAGNRDNVATTMIPDDSNDLIHDDVNGIGDLLIRNYSVNIGQWRRGIGVTINSARTLSKDAGYRFQNQVMGWLLIKRSVIKYLQSIEQDPSGSDAQERHFRVVWTYLRNKYNAGIFYKGQREDGSPTDMSDVVTIVNDFSINTLANIANGIEEMFVEVVFVPPIEEPILSLASAPVTSI